MDSEKRPSRTRKQVDYSKFAAGEDDSMDDDDFESFTPPVNTKIKKTSKQKKEKKQKLKENQGLVEIHIEPEKKSLNRKSPDEKLFQQELELALELSRTGVEDINCTSESAPKICKSQELEVDDDYIKKKATVTDASDIEVLEENIPDTTKTRNKPPRKRVYEETFSDDDDGYMLRDDVPSEDDSESDFNPDADNDFEGSGTKKKKKAKPPQKKPNRKAGEEISVKTPSSNNKSVMKIQGKKIEKKAVLSKTPTVKREQPQTIGVSQAISPSPVIRGKLEDMTKTPVNKSTLPLKCIQVKTPVTGIKNGCVKSPGTGLGGVQIKSPGSGGLRLGLSRNIRLKPLHPGVKVSPR